MKKKLIFFNITIITLSLLTLFFSGLSVSKKSHYDEAEKNIIALTKVYVANYNDHITENVPSGVRVTVVGVFGTVIADSDDKSVIGKDHIDREEIVAALAGRPKTVIRKSETLGRDMVYYAEKADAQHGSVVVRVAIPVESVNDYISKTIPTCLWVLISALFVSYIMSIFVADSVIKPLQDVKNSLAAVEEGKVVGKRKPTGDTEVDEIMGEIDGVADKLNRSAKTAVDEKERLDYILSNVSDGIIVVDRKGEVETMNKVACRIFGGDGYSGKDYTVLSSDDKFTATVGECVKDGKNGELDYNDDGKTYMTSVRSLENGYTIIVLTDITAVRKGEKMRGEFFANASHELKTPLTAIKGFNDLVSLKTDDEEIKEFTAKTDKEISRILTLISDMLDLSKLESQKEINAEKIELKDVAEEVKDSLAGIADRKKTAVTVEGDGCVFMEREHAVELVKNLVENGIRYGNDGGYVKVKILHAIGETVLSVEDNGIGIEEKHLGRICERFYRVNKSRSRESGGTGLGLAIVKHICVLYSADLDISSVYGVGTTVTVKIKTA